MKKTWKEKIILFILLFSFLMSCQKQEEIRVHSLKVNFQEGDLPSLHPHEVMIFLRGISIGKTLNEGLTRIDHEGNPVLAGAKSMEISLDGLQYRFTLRENAWSNGSPVTAHHFEKAWKEALSPNSTCPRADLLYMIKNGEEAKKGLIPTDQVRVTALNDKTLVVELAYPSPYFLDLLAQPVCAPLFDPKKKEPTEFSGPFMLDKWVRGSSLTFKPNPHFWNRQNVSIKQIEVSFVEDPLTTFSLFEKGKLDWIGVPMGPLTAEQITHLSNKKAIYSYPIDRSFWVFLNTKHPALSSPKIRKALSLSINRDAITKHILMGGRPLAKALAPNMLPSSFHFPLKENRMEAKKLFEEGLKELKLSKESFPALTVTYSQQANRKQLAEYLREAWTDALGINVELQNQEWNVLRTNLAKGQFVICGAFEAAYYKDPLEMLERFTSINSNNFTQWTYPPFKEKIAEAKYEIDPEKRMEHLAVAEKILIEEMPFIPICSDCFFFGRNAQLKGYAFDSLGAIDFSYAKF